MANRGKVCLVGEPSSGKSTLFNRIIGKRKSIINEEFGITRDRIYSQASWCGEEFTLIDTGGIGIENLPFMDEVKAQVELAIDEADVIIFVLDAFRGITKSDQMISKMLYKVKEKVILCCNKIDDYIHIDKSYEFYNLGLGEVYSVSAAHGIGLGDLLDEVLKRLPVRKENKNEQKSIRFCLIGRPNVGKSSLTNAILGNNRVIASNIEGTTRDAIDTTFKREGISYTIVDTAGLKKKGKIYESVDKYAALRALDAVSEADIVLCLIEADKGLLDQDKHVIGYAIEQSKPIIIVVNKWDLHEHNQDSQEQFKLYIQKELVYLNYAPIVFSSATTKPNLEKIFDAIDKCYSSSSKQIPTSMLIEVINRAQTRNPPPSFNGGRIKITYASQIKNFPPTFNLYVNNPEYMHFSYSRYLENTIRDSFGIEYSPIKINLKRKSEKGIFK